MPHPKSEAPSNHHAGALSGWNLQDERRAAARTRLHALLRWTAICLCVGLVSVAVVHWLAKPEMRAGQWVESAHGAPKAPGP